jgi:bifunctional NMN adenylyltransferase/nudix hydrolase
MQSRKYQTIVYIGRFEPFHNGHLNVIKQALNLAWEVIVLVGSANEPRTYKNPFTFSERANMIDCSLAEHINSLPYQQRPVLTVLPLENTPYSDAAWAADVQQIVEKHTAFGTEGRPTAIIGHKKDASTYYLDMFPQWDFIDVPMVDPLDATSIRDIYFSDKCNLKWFESILPPEVMSFLTYFKEDEAYAQICRERQFLKDHAKQYEHLRYAPVFVTVDAVVIQSGHVLMVERKAEPGKGLYALPGGYLNAKTDKSLEDAMLRELREETKIKVPEKVLRGSIKGTKVFDAVDRSERGRIITHAYHIVLEDGTELPKVKGSDDAAAAFWVPLSKVKREECFEDHYAIIQNFVR